MKLHIDRLVALSLAALLFAGCAGESDTPQPTPESSPDATESETSTSQTTVDGQSAKDEEPDVGDPAPGTAVVAEGTPGSIAGVVKSDYISAAPGLAFIVRIDGREFPPPEKNPVMDQMNLIFTPHLLPILVGSTVDFPNSDTVRHNVFSEEVHCGNTAHPFNLGDYAVGVVKHEPFNRVGVVPLCCNVHAEMSGYIVVCQNPYFAVTDRRGKFSIPDVPPGKWHLRLFHEYLKDKTLVVEVKPGEETTVEFADLQKKK